jgi:hypothetical protein
LVDAARDAAVPRSRDALHPSRPGEEAIVIYDTPLLFVGLTAYDTQRIKEMYLAEDAPELAQKNAILGALSLDLAFVNLVLLLQLFGTRREE